MDEGRVATPHPSVGWEPTRLRYKQHSTIYIYIYTHKHTYTHTHICIYIYICICIYTDIYIYIYVYAYIYICVCVCVFIHICVCGGGGGGGGGGRCCIIPPVQERFWKSDPCASPPAASASCACSKTLLAPQCLMFCKSACNRQEFKICGGPAPIVDPLQPARPIVDPLQEFKICGRPAPIAQRHGNSQIQS